MRAIFLDRDGVLNYNVPSPPSNELEAPLTPADFKLIPGVLESLSLLQDSGFLLFLVSNQPNYAKGKTTLSALEAIHNKLEAELDRARIPFKAFYYCLHHPQAVVPSFATCECRKPSPYFLFKARDKYGIDMSQSWMIGDRVTDIQCGRAAGVRTIRIVDGMSATHDADTGNPDFTALNLAGAVEIVLRSADRGSKRFG